MSMTPGGPDYLDTSGPVDTAPGNDHRKRLIALGAIVAGGAAVAGTAWAATSFMATGSQPAEALPDSTIAYFSVDLDPSGGQKIEAIKTLRKFPAFTDNVNLETDDDLRERLFEEITSSGECDGLDYATDVKPWLGSRAAVAAVDLGEDQPAPVAVVQVNDAGKAEDGVATLIDLCGGTSQDGADSGSEGGIGGWIIDGGWMVLAETEEIAQQVVDAADGATLAGDTSFEQWTGEAGGDGFMSMYVAKAAAQYLDDAAGMGAVFGGVPSLGTPEGTTFDQDCLDTATTAEEINACFAATDDTSRDTGSGEIPPELQQMIDDFDGAAATVRFDDGAVEIEYAMSNYQKDLTAFIGSDEGVSMVSSLPEDTVAAFGFSLKKGWVDAMVDYVKGTMPDDGSGDLDQQLAEFETQTGLAFPEDIETLLGEGMTVSLGSGIDPDAIANGGPGEVPVGIRIKGDADEIQAVLDKISAQAGPEVAEYLKVSEGDGYAVMALQDDYRTTLESGGDLGSSDDYAKVIENGAAQSVLYVNFDADDDWLVRVTKDMPEVSDNLAPLSAFGVSGWVDGDVIHGLVKLTTD